MLVELSGQGLFGIFGITVFALVILRVIIQLIVNDLQNKSPEKNEKKKEEQKELEINDTLDTIIQQFEEDKKTGEETNILIT